MVDKKNMPLGADVVAEAMAKNKKKREDSKPSAGNTPLAAEMKTDDSPVKQVSPVVNDKAQETPPSISEKPTKGVVGAKGVKLQPVQAKLKPKLYATHLETILRVNKTTDSNITSADIVRASVHLLSKMKPEKILDAIKETAI